jgi:hypothetical protein
MILAYPRCCHGFVIVARSSTATVAVLLIARQLGRDSDLRYRGFPRLR